MSKRRQLRHHLAMLDDIGDIMAAMRNIALMETAKLGRFLGHQHRMLAGIEAAAADFLAWHPEFAGRAAGSAGVVVAVGSQRGFCGDFNDALADALRRHWRQPGNENMPAVAIGRRLSLKLEGEPRVLAALDGPSVAEEVDAVLRRVMDTLAGLRGEETPLAVAVFSHREGEATPRARPILPAPPSAAHVMRTHAPLLTLAPARFFAELARHYLWAQLHGLFYDSLMAENRRRLQHLEGAMRRMDEKAAALRRQGNVLRQEEITEEIEVIMLSAGASDGASA